MQNETLYKSIENFPLENLGGSNTFVHRLCRENNWSRTKALRAIGEYRRFLYLAVVSKVPVTPPSAIDQVWHLHLLYTRSYWDTLCGTVLRRPLHHGPTAGGKEEDEKFTNWYGSTCALYRVEFGSAPPADIWPPQFSTESRHRWIDSSRFWIIPKPGLSGLLPSVFPLFLLGGGVIPFLICVWALIVGVMAMVLAGRQARRDSGKHRDGGCSSFGPGCGSDSGGGGDCGGGDGGGGCCGGCGGGGCGGGD